MGSKVRKTDYTVVYNGFRPFLLTDVLLASKKTFLSLVWPRNEINEAISTLNNLNRYFVMRFSYRKKNVLEQT